jgi:glycosyltransferase involved in cell wall biosynthesis
MFEFLGESSAEGVRDAKQRILFVTSDKYPPFRPAARAVFADGLARQGHTVDWLIQAADPDTPPGIRRFRSGIALVAPTVTSAGRPARLRKVWLDFRNDLRIFTLLRRRDYSVVQVKDKYPGALIAMLAARLRGVPFMYWLAYPHGEASIYAARHGMARYPIFYSLRGRLQRFLLYRVILPNCAHIFVQSEQMRSDIAREGIPADRMTPVPSSVNLADFDATAADDVDFPPRCIVYLGTLLRERRLDFLVRVAARVIERVPDARLLLVGCGENPEDENILHREAARLGISKSMEITGWLPSNDARARVRGAAVCVSPYYPIPILKSTSPTKLVEYMALGRPVVANDHPEQSDVLVRSGAGVVCPWDEAAFANALVDLLEDPVRGKTMGRAGRRYVERHRTHNNMVALVHEAYRRELGGAGLSRGPGLRASGPALGTD